MRTLQGQYKALLRKNEKLNSLLTFANTRAFAAEERYTKALKKSYSIYDADPGQLNRIITIRVDLDMLDHAYAFDDMLNYLVHDIARKAGKIK